MPAFAVFIKQNVSETNFFRSLRSALMPSSRGGEKSSGVGSAGAPAASAQKKWPGMSFPRQKSSDRQRLRRKTDTEEIGFDSYIELHDSNGSSSRGDDVLKPPHLSAPRLEPVQLGEQEQPQPQPQMPAYHVPGHGIIRTTEVTQQYYPAPDEVRGQAF